jgi:hypothetical protein
MAIDVTKIICHQWDFSLHTYAFQFRNNERLVDKLTTAELFTKYFYFTIIKEIHKQEIVKFTLRKLRSKVTWVWRSIKCFVHCS